MDNQYLIKASKLIFIGKIHEKIDFQNLCWRGNKLTIRVGISSQIPMTLCTTNVPRFLYSSFRFFSHFSTCYTHTYDYSIQRYCFKIAGAGQLPSQLPLPLNKQIS